jgi:predicted transposase YdaD
MEEIDKINDEDAREVYMTAAEELRAEGMEIGRREGNTEGRIAGKQDTLVRLVEKKFGVLDSGAKRKISRCRDLNRLDRAIDLFLDAESITEVLQPLD